MIAEDALETALRALHEAFELERPESAAVESSGASVNAAGGGSAGR
jgi:hypothetical protein